MYKIQWRDFPRRPGVLRLNSSNAGGSGSIPIWGTKIPHALRHREKKKETVLGKKEKGLRKKNPMEAQTKVRVAFRSRHVGGRALLVKEKAR